MLLDPRVFAVYRNFLQIGSVRVVPIKYSVTRRRAIQVTIMPEQT